MIETDAYCAWRHFHPDGEHADFTEELALQLLTNAFDKVGTETRRSVSLENTILDVHADETLAHDIVLLTEHPKDARSKKTATGGSKKALFRCHVCRNMATMYCKTCAMCIPHNTNEMVIACCVQHHICTQVKVHQLSLHAWSEYLILKCLCQGN